MRIALASDHAGFALKREIADWLESQGHTTEDFGAPGTDPADLSDHVYPAALAVASGRFDRGIFVDGVGYGSALIANRIHGLTAVVCQDPFCGRLAREHTDSNVLCLGGKIIGSAIALEIVRVWMTTDFLDQPKYRARVAKVAEISDRHLVPLGKIDLPAL